MGQVIQFPGRKAGVMADIKTTVVEMTSCKVVGFDASQFSHVMVTIETHDKEACVGAICLKSGRLLVREYLPAQNFYCSNPLFRQSLISMPPESEWQIQISMGRNANIKEVLGLRTDIEKWVDITEQVSL